MAFVRLSKYWKDEITLILLFAPIAESFIAAQFIFVQTTESKKQLAKLYMPMKERDPVLLVTLKSRITFSTLPEMSLFILSFLFPQNNLQFSVSISSFKNYLLCRKYTNSKLRHFVQGLKKKKPFPPSSAVN